MDISAPTSGGPWPIFVFLPGGPSSPGELYRDILDPFAAALAGQGAVVMISGWREADYYGGGYPTSFADVACAIGVARQIGPSYGADPDRVTLVGHSTGGWPAMVVGADADAVHARTGLVQRDGWLAPAGCGSQHGRRYRRGHGPGGRPPLRRGVPGREAGDQPRGVGCL